MRDAGPAKVQGPKNKGVNYPIGLNNSPTQGASGVKWECLSSHRGEKPSYDLLQKGWWSILFPSLLCHMDFNIFHPIFIFFPLSPTKI